jgi:hypothetical protein
VFDWDGFELALAAALLGLRSTVRRGDTVSPVRTGIRERPGVNFNYIIQAALAPYFYDKKSQSQTLIREKLHKALIYEKGVCKMLMKLTPGVNFTNMFMGSFYAGRSQTGKKKVLLSFVNLRICLHKSCL